jgi:hypothetical protein
VSLYFSFVEDSIVGSGGILGLLAQANDLINRLIPFIIALTVLIFLWGIFKGRYTNYPYVDTLKYFDPDKGILSTDENSSYKVLEDTGGNIYGECERCDNRGRITCPDCGGECVVDCYECDGDGEIDCDNCSGEGKVDCGNCDGDGEIDGETCKECKGKGKIECERCENGKEECSRCEDYLSAARRRGEDRAYAGRMP